MEKHKGDHIRSGTINSGDPIIIEATTIDKNSTFRNIIKMVQAAQLEKSPMIRMADKYSLFFIFVTLAIASLTFWFTRNTSYLLGVLVIATPCPLILATPIALMGGVSAASKRLIIIKRLGSIETLSQVQALVFDKTGTLTLGKPIVKKVTYHPTQLSEKMVLAIVHYAKEQKAPLEFANNIQEKIGTGISATINGLEYYLSKTPNSLGMSIGLFSGNHEIIAEFEFDDQIKNDSQQILQELHNNGLQLSMYTGDKIDRAKALVHPLGIPMSIEANCSPQEKKEKIIALKKKGLTMGMIGDGINDAPAIAAADVGMVFSHEGQTAATDAADIVFLGGDLSLVLEAIHLSSQTVGIAKQCIFFGIGASIVGMTFAAFGFLPPIFGAFLQEGIDIIVILYALQTSQPHKKN